MQKTKQEVVLAISRDREVVIILSCQLVAVIMFHSVFRQTKIAMSLTYVARMGDDYPGLLVSREMHIQHGQSQTPTNNCWTYAYSMFTETSTLFQFSPSC